jgi:hypothetical protein
VEEFRAFVEEGGIVFVAFDDEMPARAEAETAAEVFRNAADQE